ncbi:hypothetical protein ACFQ3S_18550 [Mucilaginibacter terrae]|uniref:hypothetical protein n=1 Tax=Mucilaginibacter terrae TaxID=1955052 RepID=UPI0036459C6A
MYRQIVFPDQQHHTFELPKEFYGKKVEVVIVELTEKAVDEQIVLARNKTYLDDIESIPDFPSIEIIRKEAWPNK